MGLFRSVRSGEGGFAGWGLDLWFLFSYFVVRSSFNHGIRKLEKILKALGEADVSVGPRGGVWLEAAG